MLHIAIGSVGTLAIQWFMNSNEKITIATNYEAQEDQERELHEPPKIVLREEESHIELDLNSDKKIVAQSQSRATNVATKTAVTPEKEEVKIIESSYTPVIDSVVVASNNITVTKVAPTEVSLNNHSMVESEMEEPATDTEDLSRLELRRVDREINKRKFIFKGETIIGTSASYYSLSGENADLMLVVSGVTADISMTSIKPDFAYFYRDNRAVGGRFGFTKFKGTIDSATLDLGDTNDVEMDVPYISYSSESFSYGLFHRAYAALDNNGRFGVFADVELEASSGTSHYGYELDGEIKSVKSKNQYLNLSFNPGLAVFVMHNVSATLSFELGGISYSHIDQYNDAGEFVGSRDASKMRFMFNVFAVRFGVNFHIW